MVKLRKSILAAAVGMAVFGASAAAAAPIFSDNFDAEHGGTSSLNYTGFANWTVLAGDRVDLVANGDFGTTGTGSYVDLDGTPGPGQIFTKQAFVYGAGDLITITFDLSGSQRSAALDNFYMGLFDLSAAGNSRTHGLLSLYGNNYTLGDLANTKALGVFFDLGGGAGWTHATYSFNVGKAGSGVMYFGSNSADNVGPLIDNVTLSIASVPEPATWTMMICGFASVGAVLRRRRLIPVRA